MVIRERYLGVDFVIRESGDHTCAWEICPLPGHVLAPHNIAGTVTGGQNDAILAARRAISVYLNEKVGVRADKKTVYAGEVVAGRRPKAIPSARQALIPEKR